jgi:hypothetical protein
MGNTYKRQQILENFIYLVIWLILFFAPTIDEMYKQNTTIDWSVISHFMGAMVPFFIIFLIHNYLLMPQLLIKKKSWLYLLTTIFTICLFIFFTPSNYLINRKAPASKIDKEWKSIPPPEMDHGSMPPEPRDIPEDGGRAVNYQKKGEPNAPGSIEKPGIHDRKEFNTPREFGFLHVPFIAPFLNNLIIAILIVGFNIAIKLLFQSIRDEHQLKELEKHNLETELSYLKHQINPHFFMNTLNNIHALIDIDTEKAKETVIELSKMMRYVLYDSSQATISLEKEILFINNYIELMKLRYTDKVNIKLYLPELIPDIQIPPLLFISFLENAFKHGISYQQDSYINFSLQVNEKEIECLIANSNCQQTSNEQGIGLDNVRKRLNLLYPENYTLKIDSSADEFSVLLIIPLL